MERDGEAISGQEPGNSKVEVGGRLVRFLFSEFVRDCREQRQRRTVHHRRSETAHEPGAGRVIGKYSEIEDVLDDRKSSADGEARNDCVEFVPDTVQAEEKNDCGGLEG